jgi:1-deoxy-D-xylulose-5-phosphate reductoisomerase
MIDLQEPQSVEEVLAVDNLARITAREQVARLASG